MSEYRPDMTKVVIRLSHWGSLHKPIIISMHLASDSGCTMYNYSCDYSDQQIPTVVAAELIDNCQELAQNLIKGNRDVHSFR